MERQKDRRSQFHSGRRSAHITNEFRNARMPRTESGTFPVLGPIHNETSTLRAGRDGEGQTIIHHSSTQGKTCRHANEASIVRRVLRSFRLSMRICGRTMESYRWLEERFAFANDEFSLTAAPILLSLISLHHLGKFSVKFTWGQTLSSP